MTDTDTRAITHEACDHSGITVVLVWDLHQNRFAEDRCWARCRWCGLVFGDVEICPTYDLSGPE